MLFRKFPQDEVARVLQTQIARTVQAFTNISALADLTPSFVLLLFRRPHLTKVQLNVGRELESGPVEGASFLLRQTCLVLINRDFC